MKSIITLAALVSLTACEGSPISTMTPEQRAGMALGMMQYSAQMSESARPYQMPMQVPVYQPAMTCTAFRRSLR